MNTIEMHGFLTGKCLPGDMRVNETTAEYLVRKFREKDNQLAAVVAERDALAVANSMYREAIRTARRLINVDEMGDADVVLAKAERSISSNAAAVREIEAQAVEDAVKQVLSVDTVASTALISHLLRVYATELREASNDD